jgi:diguanylate cyclase (GGDEF)-like protein
MQTLENVRFDVSALTAVVDGASNDGEYPTDAPERDGDIAGLIDHICSGGDMSHVEETELAELVERLLAWGLTDELTGLPNRRMFARRLEEEHKRSNRTDNEFAIVLMDLDHFKRVNDSYGHQEGDRVLKLVARTVRASLRETDFLARYGGEEFCALLPDTSQGGAMQVAERARRAVSELGPPATTVSLGVAAWRPWLNTGELMARSDHALYVAKQRGRNRVEQYHKRRETAFIGSTAVVC